MRKFFTACLVLLLIACNAEAQGFLGRLKQKVNQMAGVEEEEVQQQQAPSKPSDKPVAVTGEKKLQPKRSSTLGWDAPVTPSAAGFPIPLANELPAVPSASKLANPDEADQIAYYRAITAVTMKAEKLNSDSTCEDAFTEEWRQKANKALKDAFGLTDAELATLDNPNASEAEKARIEEKMKNALLNGVDMDRMQANAAKYENMSDDEIEAASQNAVDGAMAKFYRQNASEAQYVYGCPVDEIIASTKSTASSKVQKAFEKKVEAYGRSMSAKDPKYESRAMAFNQKMSSQMQASIQQSMGLGDLQTMMGNIEKVENSFAEFQKLEQATQAYLAACKPMMEVLAKYEDVQGADSMDAVLRKKIEGIKKQIYATDKASEYNPLYLQALDIIKNWRENVAVSWASYLQGAVNEIKAQLPGYIKAQRQAIADGVIPECALNRAPLNVVIQMGDLLGEAYTNFPDEYPEMWSSEVVKNITIPEDESFCWPEFCVRMSTDDILKGNGLFKVKNGGEGADNQFYKYSNGGWGLVNEGELRKQDGVREPQSAVWTSQDGKRKVIFNADGGFLQMPEGNIIRPYAVEKKGNAIIWADMVMKGNSVEIIKCVYKL